jgi:hypothetical protein
MLTLKLFVYTIVIFFVIRYFWIRKLDITCIFESWIQLSYLLFFIYIYGDTVTFKDCLRFFTNLSARFYDTPHVGIHHMIIVYPVFFIIVVMGYGLFENFLQKVCDLQTRFYLRVIYYRSLCVPLYALILFFLISPKKTIQLFDNIYIELVAIYLYVHKFIFQYLKK